jgi:hypothetical protein
VGIISKGLFECGNQLIFFFRDISLVLLPGRFVRFLVSSQYVLQAFAGTGARAVVAENVPEYARLNGWYQVGNSNYYIYVFME